VWDLSFAPFVSLGAALLLTMATRFYRSVWMTRHPEANPPKITVSIPEEGATYDSSSPVKAEYTTSGTYDHVETNAVDEMLDMAPGEHEFIVRLEDDTNHELVSHHVHYVVA
jgi:hypothetical protein